MSTDKDWEEWGATDPYYGVLSCGHFRKSRLHREALEAFFATGATHVERVLDLIKHNFQASPAMTRTLDFGCGVGRVAIPLARRSGECFAIDVSPSMLAEASRNALRDGITNIHFRQGNLESIEPGFSLVHSYIVLQHIPWKRGRDITVKLAERVEPGGFLAIQILTTSNASVLHRAYLAVRYAIPPVNWARNLARGRRLFEPAMQLHVYDVAWIEQRLTLLGFDRIIRCDDPHVGEFSSTLLIARRGLAALRPA